MNHKNKWSHRAITTQFQTAQDLVPNQRMDKWPGECNHRMVRSTARNKRMAAQALRIPRNTQVRLARAMMVRSNRFPN